MLGVLMAIGNGIAMSVRINILAWKAFKGMRQSGKSYLFTQNNS